MFGTMVGGYTQEDMHILLDAGGGFWIMYTQEDTHMLLAFGYWWKLLNNGSSCWTMIGGF